ncbi:MAG: hypothetical protein J2O44_03915, partial [Porphyrobacter sp.]|nr:hypothetical protein [Porphyrobacter sp.]
MDMSHTPEVPELDELERDRAERRVMRGAPTRRDIGYFGTGSIAQRVRTMVAGQAFLATGNGLLALAVLTSVSAAPRWLFGVLATLTLAAAGLVWFARRFVQQDIVHPLQSSAASA